jgi:hypothetical protein
VKIKFLLFLGLASVASVSADPSEVEDGLALSAPLLTAVAAASFGANLAPVKTNTLLKNNLWGLAFTSAVALYDSEDLKVPQDKAVLLGMVYLMSAGLSRVFHSIATSEVKKEFKCFCGESFDCSSVAKFRSHLIEHDSKPADKKDIKIEKVDGATATN